MSCPRNPFTIKSGKLNRGMGILPMIHGQNTHVTKKEYPGHDTNTTFKKCPLFQGKTTFDLRTTGLEMFAINQ